MRPSDTAAPPLCHAISFFDSQEQLCEEIGSFVADGLRQGEPALIVTNPDHRRGISSELQARGVDVEETVTRGDLLLVDAEETLAALMTNGIPDSALYHQNVGAAVTQLLRGRPGPVRIFGDMVDLLWKRGEHDAAIRIELLSNQLAMYHPISVICGYSMGHFLKRAPAMQTVQHLHGRVHRPSAAADRKRSGRPSRARAS